jgi:DNA/RNA endonuclease G (NUC1)/V8-like Glu-specific endopeptidase
MPNDPSRSLVFNGVNAATGDYLLPPLPVRVVGQIARNEPIDEKHLQELRYRYQRSSKTTLGPIPGVDPSKLEQAGWGVIVANNVAPAVLDALRPLLVHRKEQAGKYYREYAGQLGYRPNESKLAFLARHGAGPGPADPEKVPYYLLIVGDPESIPFRFQYQLDVQYAVGRIAFDTVEGYANYARSVVEAETRPVALARDAVFFGASNPGDDATALSAHELVEPLASQIVSRLKPGTPPWDVRRMLGDDAKKPALSRVLGGPDTPALLFSATHGVGFPSNDPRQLAHQGALLCQEWPGPSWNQPIPPDFYFAAEDVANDANPFGLIAFFFACYGAGTPRLDDFAHAVFKDSRDIIAPHAFLSALPRRVLGHPHGGALAVVGHVDRAWGYSFHWEKAGRQLQSFESTLKQLMEGIPLGSALEFFNERYAELASHLSDELEDVKFGKIPDDYQLAGLWTANNDARSFVIIGDPAVRVAVPKANDAQQQRPALSLAVPPVVPPGVSEAREAGAAPSAGPAAGAKTVARGSTLLTQITATERRYQDRPSVTQAASFAPGVTGLLQKNPPKRIRERLTGIGVAPQLIDDLLKSGGTSFAPIPQRDEAQTAARMALERIIGQNDLIGVEFLESALQASRSVARVQVKARSGRLLGYGSGSMVSPRLFLTNNHVLDAADTAASSQIEFGYEYGPGGVLRTSRVFSLAPDTFFVTDPALDFTLVAVRKDDALGPLGWVSLRDDDGAVLVGEYVNIIQHPNGLPKQLAFRDNQVTDILSDFLHYRSDTEPGSSGSPVFSDQWEMVALHHSGVPRKNAQGQILARGGQVWTEEMGDTAIDWIANEGVRIGRILAFLRTATLPDGHGSVRDELLSAVLPPPPGGTPRVVGEGAAPDDGSQPAATRRLVVIPSAGTSLRTSKPLAGRRGEVTLRVPLQITVSLGLPEHDDDGDFTAAAVPEEAISIDPDYDSRTGYNPTFLGTSEYEVPLPKLPDDLLADAAVNTRGAAGDDQHELPYHHFTVVLNGRRRLAFFTAVNIDGRTARPLARERDKWFLDPRVPVYHQVGNELYDSNPFDRGHLVRRLDPAWGRSDRVAKVANDDTYHFSNCSPQHERFNEGNNLWAGLEDYLLKKASAEGKRLTVFTGPVFRDDDPDYRGVQIPKEFWKVAVYAKKGEGLVAAAFLVSQEKLIRPVVEEAKVEQVAKSFQTTVAEVAQLTRLDFGELKKADVMVRAGVSFVPGAEPRVELTDENRIRVE